MMLKSCNPLVCRKCGADLSRQSDGDINKQGTLVVTVDQCTACLEGARDEGYSRGRESGLVEGRGGRGA